MTKPCQTCAHPKGIHEGDVDYPTKCRVWPMPGQWAECPCTEYVGPAEMVPVVYMCGHKGQLPILVDPTTKVGALHNRPIRECPKCERRHRGYGIGLKLGQHARGMG